MSREEKKQRNIADTPHLSVAIITFNEERIIEKTLSAIDNWVDEIVVVDSHSTDDTLNILNMFNVKLIQRKWEGYSKQKNYAISKCTGDWVLVIDADEVITEPLKKEISKVIANPGKTKGFKVARKFFIGNRWIKHGGYYPDYQLRLFTKGSKAYFKERAVHESVSFEGDENVHIEYLKNPLEHYAYTDLDEYKQALSKYSVLASKEIKHKKLYTPYLRALWAFGYRYFVRKGFLEGKVGLDLAKLYGEYVFNKYEAAKSSKY